MYHWNSFLFQRNLNTHFWVFIKLKFLGILKSSQSFEEQVMTCSNCNYTIWEKKNWMQLYLNLFPCLSLHVYLLLGSWQVTRWGEHVYLVRSGGARNYVVYDVLLNFFTRSMDFRIQEILQPRVLVVMGNYCLQVSSAN